MTWSNKIHWQPEDDLELVRNNCSCRASSKWYWENLPAWFLGTISSALKKGQGRLARNWYSLTPTYKTDFKYCFWIFHLDLSSLSPMSTTWCPWHSFDQKLVFPNNILCWASRIKFYPVGMQTVWACAESTRQTQPLPDLISKPHQSIG